MSNLTIQQFCQLETLKTELHAVVSASSQYSEKIEGNLTVLELTNSEGKIIQEVIIVL